MSEKARYMIEKLRTTSVDKGGDTDAVSYILLSLFISYIKYVF